MDGASLHALARHYAAKLGQPDKKQLRFNEIVETAKLFYPTDPEGGVRELVSSCDKSDSLHVKDDPMWSRLRESYQWMIEKESP